MVGRRASTQAQYEGKFGERRRWQAGYAGKRPAPRAVGLSRSSPFVSALPVRLSRRGRGDLGVREENNAEPPFVRSTVP